MIKLAGILLLLITSATVGFIESYKLSLRVEQLERFLRFVTTVQSEIQFSSIPVRQLIAKHREDMKLLEFCHQYCEEQQDFPSAWRQATVKGTKGCGLQKKDVQMISDFGIALGSTDLAGQAAHCQLTAQLLENQLEMARQEKGKKAKLYSMLGIFFGVAMALVIS